MTSITFITLITLSISSIKMTLQLSMILIFMRLSVSLHKIPPVMLSVALSITKAFCRQDIRRVAVWIMSILLLTCGCVQFHHHDDYGHLCMHIVHSDGGNQDDNHDQTSEPDNCSLHLPSVVYQKRIDSTPAAYVGIIVGFLAPEIRLPLPALTCFRLLWRPSCASVCDKIIQYISFRAPPCA